MDKEGNEQETKIPQTLEKTLRYYQKTGFKWLKTLDYYRFGGILADDMGLGKTVQMLSVIVDYVKNIQENENEIPEIFKQQIVTVKIDKTAIKNHFKETGELIPGARIIDDKTSLRIK